MNKWHNKTKNKNKIKELSYKYIIYLYGGFYDYIK